MNETKQNWFKRHKVLSVVGGIILLLILVGAASGGSQQKTATTPSQTPSEQQTANDTKTNATAAPKSKISLADFYAQVQNGMTKAEITKLAERDPQSCTEVQDQYIGKTENCSYGGFGDGGMVSVTFTNDKVSMKTKTDL